MAKFCIDPGHGGKDPGAVNGSRKEKNDVLKLALLIKPLLEKQGHRVLLTREKDTDITIANRCRLANTAGCDYFLSLHRNSAGPNAAGIEIWVHSKAYDKTVAQAQEILTRCCEVGGKNRGVKKGAVSYTDYGVNTQTTMASALLELLFLSNGEENALFDEKLQEYAEAIARGLAAAVGETWKDKPTVKPAGVPFTVKIDKTVNVHSSPPVGQIKAKGVYTITEEKNGWGKLKSGAGWIELDQTVKL